jgi:NADPH:quinone reductase-like Zn-dependent oxidoreductase
MAKRSKVLKNGWHNGKFVSFNGDEPLMIIHNGWQTLKFVIGIEKRCLWTSIWRAVPKYIWPNCLDIRPPGILRELCMLVDEGELSIVLDPASSPNFTIDAVKNAFHVMDKRQARGKVVITVSHND